MAQIRYTHRKIYERDRRSREGKNRALFSPCFFIKEKARFYEAPPSLNLRCSMFCAVFVILPSVESRLSGLMEFVVPSDCQSRGEVFFSCLPHVLGGLDIARYKMVYEC